LVLPNECCNCQAILIKFNVILRICTSSGRESPATGQEYQSLGDMRSLGLVMVMVYGLIVRNTHFCLRFFDANH
ncbi:MULTISPECIES: hypothetical protein, partial [Spirulina sp. CCY15215]|uniref:hypothetical protein n=1 Tax=Spirulina sp. CCY15215 TaxID=2767591 RepID=UPI00194EE653